MKIVRFFIFSGFFVVVASFTLNQSAVAQTTADSIAAGAPRGEKSFDDRITTGCAYRVGKTDPGYRGYTGYMMTCDAYQCLFHPGAHTSYNRQTKMFTDANGDATKIPPREYVPYLNWTCLDAKQANRVAAKYRCSIVVEDEENWGCQVCFENRKHHYKKCKYTYNDKGEIVGTRMHIGSALQEQLDELARLRDTLVSEGKQGMLQNMGDLETLFRQTPVSDTVQGKVVAVFQDFFYRKDSAQWSGAQLGKELLVLRNRILTTLKKK